MHEQHDQVLTAILERMVRVETKIDIMSEMRSTVSLTKDTADEAKNSAITAHKRIDKIDKVIFWYATTVFGAVIVAVMALVLTKG